ncbi:alginate export family protein [Candidatus Riflebacteria bacterium]
MRKTIIMLVSFQISVLHASGLLKPFNGSLRELEEQNRFLIKRMEDIEKEISILGKKLGKRREKTGEKIDSGCWKKRLSPGEKRGRWTLSGSIRSRFETKIYQSHNGRKKSNAEFIGQRSRLKFKGKISGRSFITLRFQDRRNFGDNGQMTDNGENTELNLACFDCRDILPKTCLRIGRQELTIGDVVSPRPWSNQGLTFDAVRFSRALASGNKLDFFYSRIVEDNDKAGNDTDFGGIFARFLNWKNIKYHIHFLSRRDNKKDQSLNHFGLKITSKRNNWSYGIQGGIQRGKQVKADIRASEGHLNLGYTFKGKKRVKLGIEHSWASGDENPGDGEQKTYNLLYPRNRRRYGIINLFGFRNISEFVGTVSHNPCKKSHLKLSYHQIRLAENNDDLYNCKGKAYKRASGSQTGTFCHNIGTEFDLIYKYRYSKQLSLLLGGGIFEGGNLVKMEYPLLDGTRYFYFGTMYSFQ